MKQLAKILCLGLRDLWGAKLPAVRTETTPAIPVQPFTLKPRFSRMMPRPNHRGRLKMKTLHVHHLTDSYPANAPAHNVPEYPTPVPPHKRILIHAAKPETHRLMHHVVASPFADKIVADDVFFQLMNAAHALDFSGEPHKIRTYQPETCRENFAPPRPAHLHCRMAEPAPDFTRNKNGRCLPTPPAEYSPCHN